MHEEFEKWFKKKYPYPSSLMVTPDQKQHLRDAFFAGVNSVGLVMTKEEMDNVDMLLEILHGNQLKLNRKD